jgi:hypothetical protein
MVRWILVLSAVAVAGCSGTGQLIAESLELKRGLEERWSGTEVSVTWVDGLSHLRVTLDGPPFRQIPMDSVRPRGREIAQEAFGYFAGRRRPESITIEFVLETSAGVLRMTRSASVSFQALELQGS